jgi:hypothetical protein
MPDAELTIDDLFEAGYAICMTDIGPIVEFRTKTRRYRIDSNKVSGWWTLRYVKNFRVGGHSLLVFCAKVEDLDQLEEVNHGAI